MAFSKLNKANFNILYTTYAYPHLDYFLTAVGPYMEQDFSAYEKVQHRATKLMHGLKCLLYQEHLTRPRIPSMKNRVQRGDLIEAYKIMTGKVAVDPHCFFKRNRDERTRGHWMKLKKRSSRTHQGAQFFSNRVVMPWNKLPEEVVMAASTNNFKNLLGIHQASMM